MKVKIGTTMSGIYTYIQMLNEKKPIHVQPLIVLHSDDVVELRDALVEYLEGVNKEA